ncbi:efflux RND transporter permease subunit [Phenylobacterium montanum]|uniref:Efflux RND transporter permease subunit n=1 Tax=Phenylobacterium montanum TaxID=2823693 RepID=A0A975G1J4_9CAUL|nr:efflux RND transporter permease subunit [Caulobacter sp. S6]QUD88797.1 efflux RND transporter permease subunit [Caulobacter sp. S6]
MKAWLTGHVRSVVLAFILLTVAGLAAALNLPVSLFPHVDFARVVVSIDAGDRAADQTEIQVTRPLEEALRGVPGVSHIRSTTSRGAADIALSFDWGHDMVAATLQTEAAVNAAMPDLPPGVRFTVKRMDPTVFPILGLAVSSPSRDPVKVRQFVDLQLRPLVASVPGVAAVDVLGGGQAEYQVLIDPARLQALGLSADDVVKAIAANNVVNAVGKLEDRHRLYLTLVDTRLSSAADLGQIAVKTGATPGAGVVPLSAVAQIQLAPAPMWTRITAQGRDAVLVNIRQSPEADSVALAKAVRARLAELSKHTPSDINVATFYDQTELVTGAAGSVRDAIFLGALLAGAVLFLFLRSSRLMLITAIMLPAVLASACLLLFVLHMSFNMMTLGGLAAAVGLVVDDVVVMLEHLMRRLQEAPEAEAKSGILAAAGEMARPLIGSSLSTVVVFAPLAFLTGVTGGFFKALAVTMSAALIISLLFALFVAPVLAQAWVRRQDVEAADAADRMTHPIAGGYQRAIGWTLGRPLLAVGVIAAIFLGLGGLAYSQLGTGFMPKMDEGGFVLDYKAKPGAALSDTDRLLRQVEEIIRSTPDVDSYSRRTGAQLGGGLTEADEGDFFIHLKKGKRRGVEEVMAEIRQRVGAEVPGLDVEIAQLMEDLIGDLTAVPQPIEIKLFGPNPDALKTAAKTIAPAIGKIDGVVEVVDGLRVAGDALVVKVNRPAAALEGLDPDAVSKQLEDLVGGQVATQVQKGELLYGVRVWTGASLRDRVGAIANLRLHAPDGHDLPLSRIATVVVEPGQQQITREDLQPFVGVTARLEHRDMGSAMAEVKKTIAGLALPAGVRIEYGGLYAQQQSSFVDLAVVFAAALLLVSLLLLYLFERWRVVISVLAVVLMAAAAVFVGLWATGTELNISALMGLTMVVGIITELAIFFFAEVELDQHVDASHLTTAGLARLRPILMSAVIAILALSPLALGLGQGSAMQRPLAIAIISGLLAGAPLVLMVLPALFEALSRKRA